MEKTNKKEIVFVFPNALGGVAAFNYNIINFATSRKDFYIKVIKIRTLEDTRPRITENYKVDEEVDFHYSVFDNRYFVKKRLNKLIGNRRGVVVCDNDLTIETCWLFDTSKIVIHLIHDYFYLLQTINLKDGIDVVISHSTFFRDSIYSALPTSFSQSNYYIPYGVKQAPINFKKPINEVLNICFIGRLEDSKGVTALFDIDDLLVNEGIVVNWNIIGQGSLKEALLNQWKMKENVVFLEAKTNDQILNTLDEMDLFVFPTEFEGTPVSILESISRGVVPIVTNLPGGIRDIVNVEIGFRIELRDYVGFFEKIRLLHVDRDLLFKMQHAAIDFSRKNFDIAVNADNYFKLFNNLMFVNNLKSRKHYTKIGLIDSPLIPNVVTKIFRKIKWKIQNV